MSARRLLAVVLLCVAGIARASIAQGVPRVPSAPADTATPGSELTVSLITVGQGPEIFERFGHDALWFQDERTHVDVAYHWGLFDFNDPGFVLRFLTGDTHYWMGMASPRALIDAERAAGREVTVQRLNLTPSQKVALRDYVRWNARDENKFYRYDYFRDNCATRLRDALDHALDGALKRATDTVLTTITYRRETVRLADGDLPLQVGVDIALGKPADERITEWESFFIPMRMRDGIRHVQVPQQDGSRRPLVDRESTVPPLLGMKPMVEAPIAPRLTPALGLIGFLLAGGVIALRLVLPRNRAAAWALALFGSAWSLVCGLIGVILLLAWFATRHVFWASNENVLLLTPLSLLLVPLLPMSLLAGRMEQGARITGALVMMCALLGVVLVIIPGGQESRAIVALFVPVHLALAWALSLPRNTTPLP